MKVIRIETEGEYRLHDKIKSGARALDKKIEQPNRDTNSKYEEEKSNEKA